MILSDLYTHDEARRIWDEHVAGVNIMTPNPLSYMGREGFTTRRGIIVELSEGTDFSRNTMYGVSVLRPDDEGGWSLDHDSCRLFQKTDGEAENALIRAARYARRLLGYPE